MGPDLKITRRDAMLKALFGGGSFLGLRTLATGIPFGVLLDPALAKADEAMDFASNAQFVIYSTSARGCPVNANVPGMYETSDIGHAKDDIMTGVGIKLGNGQTVKGAKIWSTLDRDLLDRTCFFHHATQTSIHPDEGRTLRLMGKVAGGEMLPSMLSRELAASLKTIIPQPISLSGEISETIYYGGAPQPLITPTSLAASLAKPSSGLGDKNIMKIRDAGLDELNKWLKTNGTKSQKEFVDKHASSRESLRKLQDKLLKSLDSIEDDSPTSQIKAAIILFKMSVTPVVVVHIPFGSDNHGDGDLKREVEDHKTSLQTLNAMAKILDDEKMGDKVTFALSNVFGRTLPADKTQDGRNHNANHAVSLIMGPRMKGSVVGGVAPKDLRASAIDSASGKATAEGDIKFEDTFGSMGKTMAKAVGLPDEVIEKQILGGKIVNVALKD